VATSLFKAILCPIDLDELFPDALEFGKNLARQNDAKLYVLNVASDYNGDRGWAGGSRISLRQQAQTILQGDVPFEFVVRSGEVVDEIMAAIAAFEADLIVIPTHGRRGMKSVMLGSVAQRIVRESPVPVLTLRAR
jgi:nucleotide-binding universal stress UspA family protein